MKSNLKRGMQVPPPRGPGGFLARPFRDLLCQIAQSVMNLNIKAIIANPGVTPTTVDARMTYTPSGVTAELDLTAIAAVAAGSASVPFSGSGAPSVSTLASGSYLAGPVPSLYVDMTGLVLYACTTAGDASTSVWSVIGGGSGGLNYRGLWSSSVTYSENDLVLVQTGVGAGGYISMANSNTADPTTGAPYWVQWPQTQSVGSWT